MRFLWVDHYYIEEDPKPIEVHTFLFSLSIPPKYIISTIIFIGLGSRDYRFQRLGQTNPSLILLGKVNCNG